MCLQAQCVYAGPGNVSCVCNEGWTGDGVLCVEISNCLMENRGGCHKHADCTPTGPGQVTPQDLFTAALRPDVLYIFPLNILYQANSCFVLHLEQNPLSHVYVSYILLHNLIDCNNLF